MDKGSIVSLLPDGIGDRISGLLEMNLSSFISGGVLIKSILLTDRAGDLIISLSQKYALVLA